MRLTPLVRKALDFSATVHKDHLRVGLNVPYIVHPVAVASLVSNYVQDEEVVSAALLHDVVEDSNGYTAEHMQRDFGGRISMLVDSVTENKYDSFGKIKPWQERKESYLEKLRGGSSESRLICVADTIHNIESLLQTISQCGNEILGQFGAGLDKKILFYEQIIRTIGGSIPNELRERLVSLVEELRKYC